MRGPVIALVDGEHHPAAVRESLDRLEEERGVAAVVFCGGGEKVRDGVIEDAAQHYGRPLETGGPEDALRRLAGGAVAVVDLGDEPSLSPRERYRIASLALHLGLDYEAPGARLEAPRYEPVAFRGPKLAVIGTGKRTGKTAVAGHLAALLGERGGRPVVVSIGRGGPSPPEIAAAQTGLDQLCELAARGAHAASDYLEHAVLTGLPSIGCRRVGGGPAGMPADSNVAQAAELAASLDCDTLAIDGSGASVPPLEVDRTVCVAGSGALEFLGPLRLLRADLLLTADEAIAADLERRFSAPVALFRLRGEPLEPVPDGARVACFTTGSPPPQGVDPVMASTNLARRAELAEDVRLAVAERCDVWLTELKAAAIDVVAERARDENARVIFLTNRPFGVDNDLDAALVKLHDDA